MQIETNPQPEARDELYTPKDTTSQAAPGSTIPFSTERISAVAILNWAYVPVHITVKWFDPDTRLAQEKRLMNYWIDHATRLYPLTLTGVPEGSMVQFPLVIKDQLTLELGKLFIYDSSVKRMVTFKAKSTAAVGGVVSYEVDGVTSY
ncbi:hypothetical protein FRB96_001055 [Tulasnella sp. 330]|nr:hypothetical protein FRB96_001055 [Tulasnella sp. 330]